MARKRDYTEKRKGSSHSGKNGIDVREGGMVNSRKVGGAGRKRRAVLKSVTRTSKKRMRISPRRKKHEKAGPPHQKHRKSLLPKTGDQQENPKVTLRERSSPGGKKSCGSG